MTSPIVALTVWNTYFYFSIQPGDFCILYIQHIIISEIIDISNIYYLFSFIFIFLLFIIINGLANY